MKPHVSRLLPVTAAVALMLAACGSSDDTPSAGDAPVDTTADSVDGEALRSPTPIRSSGTGSPASSSQAAGASALGADEAMSSEMLIAPWTVVGEFVVGDDLGALPSATTGYVFDAGAMPSALDATAVATALGAEGDPVLVDDGYSVSYRVGPDDGSAPSIVVWDDAMLSWNYSSAWADEPVFECAAGGSADVAVVDPDDGSATSGEAEPATVESLPRPDVDCVEPEPPAGVPSASAAEALAVDLLEALGIDAGSVTFDTWADEWSAQVTASETIGGVVTRSWGFSFGGDARLTYAWGSLASPEPVGPYDLIDLDTAVERLSDGRYGFGFPGGPGIAVLESGDVAVSAPADTPDDDASEPEEITVTLTGVEADLWWIWDVDGSAWLVPAYAFTGDDGGVYTVPAVTDEFLVEVEPPVDEPVEPPVDEPGEPIPVEPDGGIGDGAEPLPAPGDPAALAAVVGDPLAAFTEYAESLGFTVRTVEINGEGLAVTADFDPARVNVAIVGDGGEDYVVRATMDDGTLIAEAEIPGVTVVTIASIHEQVAYYPACGNERLEFEGVTWYPLSDTSQSDVADILAAAGAVEREPFPSTSGFARVAPPGPGDDVGTLVIWTDGIARWVSDSGNLDTWLTTAEITYPWEC